MKSIRSISSIGIFVFASATLLATWAFPQDPTSATPSTTTVPAAPVNENGAINFSFNSGFSFGVPAVRASVSAPGVGSATSPAKKVLPVFGFGATIRARKYFVPYIDFSGVDTGKAFAQVGSFRSEAQADTYTFSGGLRLIGSKSRFRPYVQFGGGVLNQNLKGNFIVSGKNTPISASASFGTFNYGFGAQRIIGKKWGTACGFDGYHTSQPISTGAQNFTKLHCGMFYQTKTDVEK